MEYKKEIAELQNTLLQLEQFRIKELRSPKKRPKSLVGINSTLYLLRILERSCDLIEGSIEMIHSKNAIGLPLLVRAHLETTASLCHFYYKIQKHYKGEIDATKFDEILLRLSLGSREKVKLEGEYIIPDPINVMTMLETSKKLLKEVGATPEMLQRSYDIVSEYSHPNWMGISYKTKVKKGDVKFLSKEESFQVHSKTIVLKLLISTSLFLMFFKKAVLIVRKPLIKKLKK